MAFSPSLEQLLLADGTWRSRAIEVPDGPFRRVVDDYLDALLVRPCVVLFSGGVDSSLLLTLLTMRAREVGARPPVPWTYRYAHSAASNETDAQEFLVQRLGLDEWVIEERSHDHEAIGPIAERFSTLVGCPTLPTAHTHLTTFERLAGGERWNVITGDGGDEFFGARRAALPGAAARHAWHNRTNPRAIRRVVRPAVRGFFRSPRPDPPQRWRPWLTPLAVREAAERHLLLDRREPLSRIAAVEAYIGRGWVTRTNDAIRSVADRMGVDLVNPWFDAALLGSMCRSVPRRAFVSRAELISWIWPNVLPPEILNRRTKATFTEVYFGDRCTAFAEAWDGRSLSSPYIDHNALRRAFADPGLRAGSLHVLQLAWLAETGQI